MNGEHDTLLSKLIILLAIKIPIKGYNFHAKAMSR